MRNKTILHQKLIEAGATPAMLVQYQYYQDSKNKQGQKRLLFQCRRIKSEELNKKREQLACLDYMIAKIQRFYKE